MKQDRHQAFKGAAAITKVWFAEQLPHHSFGLDRPQPWTKEGRIRDRIIPNSKFFVWLPHDWSRRWSYRELLGELEAAKFKEHKARAVAARETARIEQLALERTHAQAIRRIEGVILAGRGAGGACAGPFSPGKDGIRTYLHETESAPLLSREEEIAHRQAYRGWRRGWGASEERNDPGQSTAGSHGRQEIHGQPGFNLSST